MRRVGITRCHCYNINFLALRDRLATKLADFRTVTFAPRNGLIALFG
jgi:hypothetical protein